MNSRETSEPRVETRDLICPVCDEPLTSRKAKVRITCRECGSTFRVDALEDQQARL